MGSGDLCDDRLDLTGGLARHASSVHVPLMLRVPLGCCISLPWVYRADHLPIHARMHADAMHLRVLRYAHSAVCYPRCRMPSRCVS